MKKLQFTIEIKASKEKVWSTMLEDKTYRQWAATFSPGSYYKGDWSKGSKMHFLGPNPQTGEEGGMVSEVLENRPHEFISLGHIGFVQNGKEDTVSEEAKKWTSAFENYTFNEKNGATELVVDLNVTDELAEEFEKMWPDALQKLKELSEIK
ncbi:MAG: SRPBCC domain-containing protein [Candidatus Buchananbacteria bacterium]|nr:SRPBCC domain-containing protein [Candidatus Buchananbacteria bacterium]